jgi:cytochrome c oxidase subunit 2
MPGLPIFPAEASTMAGRVDALYFFLVAMSAFFIVLIGSLVLYFSIRYRRRSASAVGAKVSSALALELAWTLIPLALSMGIFVWASSLYYSMSAAPADALDIYAVGKQWMWKFQHLEGQREIDELHVPAGRAVRLTMTSEDVIHSFYVPEFRIKADVLPGRYTTAWFTPTKPGRYHLFCAEYCGTKHSGMVGSIYVMEPAEFEAWLGGGTGGETLAASGQKLFADRACASCHRSDAEGRGPALEGLFGKAVKLSTGEVVTADEGYIRESILNPGAKITAGFQPIMPTFQGLLSEEQLLQLIEYIKSLGAKPGQAAGAAAEAPPPAVATKPAPPKK